MARIGQPLLDVLGAWLVDVLVLGSAVPLQRLDGGDDDGDAGLQPAGAAGDVAELLHAEVGAEAGLEDDVVGELLRRLYGDEARAAVRDVCEWAAVDDAGGPLDGLDEVGLNRVLHQDRHGADDLKLTRRHWLPLLVVGDRDRRHAPLEVHEVAAYGVDGGDLGGGGDLEAALVGDAVVLAAEAYDHLAEGPALDVDDALPHDVVEAYAQLVAAVYVVLHDAGEEVVGAGDGV